MFEAVDGRDVWVIEGRKGFGFAFESGEAFGVGCEGFGKDLYRDITAQLRISCAIDLARAAFAKHAGDFEGANFCAGFHSCRASQSRFSQTDLV